MQIAMKECYGPKNITPPTTNESICFLYPDLPQAFPDSKVHGANMGPIWGRQDPGGPHVGPVNLAIWVVVSIN